MFEGRPDAALEHATPIFEACPDPEAVFHAARNLAFFGEPRALIELGRSLNRGFVLYRVLLRTTRGWIRFGRPASSSASSSNPVRRTSSA